MIIIRKSYIDNLIILNLEWKYQLLFYLLFLLTLPQLNLTAGHVKLRVVIGLVALAVPELQLLLLIAKLIVNHLLQVNKTMFPLLLIVLIPQLQLLKHWLLLLLTTSNSKMSLLTWHSLLPPLVEQLLLMRPMFSMEISLLLLMDLHYPHGAPLLPPLLKPPLLFPPKPTVPFSTPPMEETLASLSNMVSSWKHSHSQ